ncbi:hypothetical protein D3C80_1171940 [compost metagenome]
MTVHHHAHAQIFTRFTFAVFAKFGYCAQRGCFRRLPAGIGITLRIENQNIDVFGQAQDVIQPPKADIVGPAVTANQPDRFFYQRVGVG